MHLNLELIFMTHDVYFGKLQQKTWTENSKYFELELEDSNFEFA